MKKIEWRLYKSPVLHQDPFFYPELTLLPIKTNYYEDCHERERLTKTPLKKKREKCVSDTHNLRRELLIAVIVLLL